MMAAEEDDSFVDRTAAAQYNILVCTMLHQSSLVTE